MAMAKAIRGRGFQGIINRFYTIMSKVSKMFETWRDTRRAANVQVHVRLIHDEKQQRTRDYV